MGDINIHDAEGMTPLHCAAHLGRSRHIALLNSGNQKNSFWNDVLNAIPKTMQLWTVTPLQSTVKVKQLSIGQLLTRIPVAYWLSSMPTLPY